MTFDETLRIASAFVFFAIAIVAIARASDNPLGRPLAAFALGLSTYLVLELVSTRTGIRELTWVENAIASVTLIFGIELLVGFVGRRRELRALRLAAVVVFSALALVCLSPFVSRDLESLQVGPAWPLAFALAMVFFFGRALALLFAHHRKASPPERARVQLLAGSLLLGAGSAAVTLLGQAGLPLPRVLEPGLAGTGLLLAALVSRSRFMNDVSVLALANALVVAALVALAELALYAWAGERTAVLGFGTVVLVLAAIAVVRPVIATIATERARREQHAALGRLASQMAHDVKNPLAAILGAAEILEAERAEGRSLDGQSALVTLVLEQARRLRTVIDDYQRLARVEPRLRAVDVGELLRTIAAAQRLAAPDGVTIEVFVADALPELSADDDMLAVAIENVVRNAFEAMSRGGVLTLRARATTTERERAVAIEIEDSGSGMDARTLERARDAFFTTKASGSGLGLAYVARVVEAHRGSLDLKSAEGRGTRVVITLPIA